MAETNYIITSGGGIAPVLITTTNVITYACDPLYRLTSASYSGATTYTFAYAYDAVGNRTIQTQTITSTLVTTYTYDAANRLTNVNTLAGTGGQAYTWDNNGNLTNDGGKVYTYTQANRLITVTASGLTWSAAYNGDGARLKQVANGAPTTYTLDLASPLPVVLQATTGSASTQYVFGMGTRPLAEYDSAWEYPLPDGLGSVRQLVDSGGNVKLTKSYEPYGSVLSSQGSATSAFGFTGEQLDNATSLVFLRARYMQPGLGRFVTRDVWPGSPNRPVSNNGWLYVYSNPVNLTDPTGKFPVWCKSASSALAYSKCVLDFYRLQPAEDSDATSEISGFPGCFSGPVPYRAPGYLEGFGGFGTFVWTGYERVYDFATMESHLFGYFGGGVNDSVEGAGIADYAGVVFGFRSSRDILRDYSGPFFDFQLGVGSDFGLGVPVGVGSGLIGFVAPSDPSIYGVSWYVGGSLSADLIPVLEVGMALLQYWPNPGSPKSYILPNGKVDQASLFGDLLSGTGSVWTVPMAFGNQPPYIGPRHLALGLAGRYATIYEDMHNEAP